MRKTKFYNKEERNWLLIDAKDRVLGRLSTQIAKILQGKNKPTYTPNFLCGDRVVVVNAGKIKVTTNKLESKIYDKYSGYPSGRKEITMKTLMDKNPVKALQLSVKGMLPKNHLGREMLKSLKIYAGPEHSQQAQKPRLIEV